MMWARGRAQLTSPPAANPTAGATSQSEANSLCDSGCAIETTQG